MQPMTDAQISTLRTGIGDYAALSNPISSSPANFLIEAWVSNQASSDGNGHYVSFSGAADSRMDVGRAIAGANSALGVTNKSFGEGRNEQTRVEHGEFGDTANPSFRERVAAIATNLLHGQLHAQGDVDVPHDTHDFLHALATEALDHATMGFADYVEHETTPQNDLDRLSLADHLISDHITAISALIANAVAKFMWLDMLLKSFGDAGNTQTREDNGEFGADSGLAAEGKAMLDARATNAAPISDALPLHDAYTAAQGSWRGVTIDTHTGEAIAPTDGYAVTARTPGQAEISVPENATEDEFNAAVQQAIATYPQLANEGMNLGVFHDDRKGTIDIDPTVVVATTHEVDAIVAYNGATGGAYDFSTGLGYWPPGTKKFEWLDILTKRFGDPGSTQTREPNGTFGAAAFHSSQQGRYTVSTYRNTAANRNALHAERTAQGHDAIEHESTRYPGVMVRDTFHNTVDADGSAITVVRDENGNIIGGAQFYPGSTNGNAYFSTTTITDFFPNGSQSVEDRGQGAGRAALQEIAQVSANAGVGMSLLGSITAPEFYQHMGFDIGDTSQGQSGYGTLSLEQTQALASKMLTADMMKGFGDPGSTQEQDALGHFTDGTGVQGLWFARTSPYAKDFGDKGHFVPTASQKQLDAATAALAAHGMTVDDIMRLQQAALEKGEGVAQAAGISPEQTAAWYVTEQEMADAWVDHGYFPLQEAGMVAATTANVKFSETYANDTPNFAAGTTTYANFTAAASCAAYVSDNPELPITEEDAERINAASTGYNLDTGKIGMTPSGLDEFGGVPIPGGQNAVVATVNDDGTPILDENGDPIVVHANDLSDQQLGKYISMAGNSLIPGVAVGYPNSIANGVAIARGADPTSVIQGNKESSFMSNFAYPTESDTTTMDSHMGAISLNANGDDVVPGTVVQGDDGKLTITPSQGGFLTNLPVVDTDGNPVIGGDGKPKTYNEVAAFLGKRGGYVTLNNITLQVAANNNMVGNNAQALMWISDTNPKDVQSMKAAKITNAVWLPPYLPDSDEEPDTDKLTATPPPLAMRCVVTSANVNHAPWRKAASKSFGSPGNTQSRVAHGEFGMAEGAPNQSAADKKLEDKAIAHFGAADELQGQQFITPNGTILNFEGDGHDRIKEVQQR
jgi:hypothetical protein